ncbi:DNA/RNA non-specific endonuclease [Enterococcus faecalis]|uniref:DNA/RNA non-specific endonuclease n=1 Tax=Enterococcus faecalis TaxID=1351 RepID=UPI0002079701|nr:DNA/RNA non-specific endonuclease [Enterococcus faecalis]EGG52275.1 DNA/RNA non-specific endonuclease [Enterococcus faecalis TX1467]EIB6793402.1 DNA/RNA non-specific endonuclease [Enterococcus faecalis]MBJ1323259.1 DNA/RNA non-specific endonuclease [Enterococcus faecalis]MBJ1788518.1 DNA/RNA non-specific endonuclease [Enterococcus faecalis]MDK7976449.1 DNA/RNA non-specific endonuclease [Enterococcus faecalis]
MNKKLKQRIIVLIGLILTGVGFGNNQAITDFLTLPIKESIQKVTTPSEKKKVQSNEQTPTTTSESYDANQYKELAALDFKSGDSAVFTVNNGRSTLDISQWEENKVIYGDLDPLNRTTFVTAYLDRKNLGRSEGRERQVWKPTGWHQKKVDGELIVNRGHLLAYTSSFNFDSDGNFREGESGSQDNPKNLATQTAFSNQNVQTIYEKKVRDAQKTTGNKVIYQIVTVFRGNELMPRGYWLQAIDSNGILNFNVYVYNVQPKVVFNYEDGTSTIDRSLTIR